MNHSSQPTLSVLRTFRGLATLLVAALSPACIIVPTDDFESDPIEEVDETDEVDPPAETDPSEEAEEPQEILPPTGLSLGNELNALPMMGGSGGEAFSDACPAGQVLVGLGGYFDDRGWHGMMAAGCSPIELIQVDDGSFVVSVGEWTATPMHGEAGQQPWISECPENEMMVGFAGRSGLLVDQVQVACAALEVVETTEGFALVAGEAHLLDAVGGNGGAAFELVTCDSGSVATVVDMRAGESIDALGVSCREIGLSF